MPNYEVLVSLLGPYPKGSVLPEFAVRRAGSVVDMLGRGVVKATRDPVNVDLDPPPAAGAAPAAAPEAYAEIDRLRAERDGHKADAEQWEGQAKALSAQAEDLTAELAKYVAHHGELRRAVAALEADLAAQKDEVVRLTQELDAATTPAG